MHARRPSSRRSVRLALGAFAHIAAVSALLLPAGCAPRPVVQAVLSLPADAPCDPAPALAAALPVALDGKPVEAALGPPGRCIRRGAGPGVSYALFRLPIKPAPYTMAIVSVAAGGNLVRPRATLLDAVGAPGRTIPPDEFMPSIVGLGAGLRATGHDAFLLVEADPARLGQKQDLQLGAIDPPIAPSPIRLASAAPVILLPYIPPMIPDIVRHAEATISLNGLVRVSTAPIEQLGRPAGQLSAMSAGRWAP